MSSSTNQSPRMASLRTLAFRSVVLSVMALALGGPTPGQIGGCSASAGSVDPEQFCVDYEARICARDQAAGRLDGPGYSGCVGSIATGCEGRNWPVGCAPSSSTANACLDALVDATRVGTAESDLPECQALCPGGI